MIHGQIMVPLIQARADAGGTELSEDAAEGGKLAHRVSLISYVSLVGYKSGVSRVSRYN